MDTPTPTPAHVDPASSLDRRLLLGAAGLAGVAALSSLTSRAGAGPLNPPAGAVAATGKTLTEVEPRIAVNSTNTPGDATSIYRITQPGSYYLTGNIQGVPGKNGIVIRADGVTLDLCGFRVTGIGVATALAGILNQIPNAALVIRNGTVDYWPSGGLILTLSQGVIVENIHASFNAGSGISQTNPITVNLHGSTIISRCTATNNGALGITVDTNAIVEHCAAADNAGNGIQAGISSTIDACTARFNGASGIVGGGGSLVTGCVASDNASHGIGFTGSGSTVLGCAAYNNTANGFNCGASFTVADCVSYSNTSSGFASGSGGAFAGCTSYNNGIDGFQCGSGVLVDNCTARVNLRCGIVVSASCRVTGCLVTNNGGASTLGAGIRFTGNDNHAESNTVVSNYRGLEIASPGTGNIVIRNTFSGSSTGHFVIGTAGNALGTLAAAATNAASFTSNTYAGTISITDPTANIAY